MGTRASLSDGNLTYNGVTTDVTGCGATMGITSGKWYWEIHATDSGSGYFYFGLSSGFEGGGEYYQGYSYLNGLVSGGVRYRDNGTISDDSAADDPDRWGTVSVSSTGVSTIDNDDIVMVALDYDNKKVWFGKNGTFYNSGNPATGSNETIGSSYFTSGEAYLPALIFYGTNDGSFNFGSPPYSISSGNSDGNSYGNFEYSVPSGYYALNTKNLAEYG